LQIELNDFVALRFDCLLMMNLFELNLFVLTVYCPEGKQHVLFATFTQSKIDASDSQECHWALPYLSSSLVFFSLQSTDVGWRFQSSDIY
jgi:hypothetical protein